MERLPARILVQIREGTPNLLSEFGLEVLSGESLPHETKPETVVHNANLMSIIDGLMLAAGPLIAEVIEGQKTEKQRKEIVAWLHATIELYAVREEAPKPKPPE